MWYLADRAAAYEHPRHILEGARSILMLGMNYRTAEPAPAGPGQGRVSRYAWGADYHEVIRTRLRTLAQFHRRLRPSAGVRGVVDTAPLMEREFAQLAGLGWIGKNTLLFNRQFGSWLFLAALLTTEPLDYDAPHDRDYCGSCQACLDACPTGALVEPYWLDARRCTSYLTIELRGCLPAEARGSQGEWLFGCDLCQEVCPWNRGTPATGERAFKPSHGMNPVELNGLFDLDEAAFRERFRRAPLWRARRRGLLRNAAMVLGSRPHEEGLTGLLRGLNDPEPQVRAASAWALGRHAAPAAREALTARLRVEPDREVRCEIEAALE
jgi:epoxyqueuosine reductase